MTAAEKSKFTKEEKQEIWQYILETSIPGTVKLHRDFALERKLFNHSRFALNLWNACYRQNRWEEFHITDKERRPADLAHTGINNNIILPDQLVEMVHKKSIADYNAACIKLLKETHSYDDLIEKPYHTTDAILIQLAQKDKYIKFGGYPFIYMPIWGFKYANLMQYQNVYVPINPCLYFPHIGTPDKLICLTDDLFCAYSHDNTLYPYRTKFKWCSFYTIDGSATNVDFSPLRNKKLVIIVYPRIGVTPAVQLQNALNLYNNVIRCGATDVIFAVYIDLCCNHNWPRTEPLLMDINELGNMHARAAGIIQEVYRPGWANQALSSTPQKLIDCPELLKNSIISLTGGSQSTQLAFLAALSASIANGATILPDMKQVIGGPVYCVLGRDKFDGMRKLYHSAKNLIKKDALTQNQAPPWAFNILPVGYGKLPETDWERSGKLIDSQVNGPPYNKNVNAIIIDCQALEQTFEKLPEVSAEFCNYVNSLTARGFAVILLTYPRSWLTKSVSFTAKWRICNEKVAASGISFTLSIAAQRKIAIQYRVCFDPALKWMRGARPALSEQIKKIESLYRKNMKKPFGTGKHGDLTIQDLMNATGYSESQVKKLRGLVGVAKKCPQRGIRKSKKVPVRYY